MNKIINIPAITGVLLFIGSTLLVSAETSESAGVEKYNSGGSKQKYYFTAYLDDDPIGYHFFDVTTTKNKNTRVISEAKFDIEFLFITVYSYRHKNTELWDNNCLYSMDAVTDDNGDDLKVVITSEQNGVKIETKNNTMIAESCVRSFAYWNPDLIKYNQLINSQTGEIIDIDYSYMGSEIIQVKNHSISADRIQLKGKDKQGVDIEIDLWYSDNKQWLALRSRLENGSYLHYKLSERKI